MVNISYAGSAPSVPDHKVFVARVFQGRNVSAYMLWDAIFGERVAYKTNGMETAQAIYNPRKNLTSKQREALKTAFADYPELLSFVDTMDDKMVKENPLVLLKKMDEVLK